MKVRAKKKKIRILIILIAVLLLGCVGAGAHYLQQRQFDKRSFESRAKGMTFFQNGDYLSAAHHLGKFLRRFDSDVQALYCYAYAKSRVPSPRGKNIYDAIGSMRRVVALDASHESAREDLLRLYALVDYHIEAIDIADQILAKDATNRTALRIKAISFVHLRRFSDALPVTQAYLDEDEMDIRMHLLQFRILEQLGRPAEEWFSKARLLRRIHPGNPQFDLLQAFAHRLTNDRKETERWLRRAASQPPPSSSFAAILVRFLDESQLFDLSMAVLEQVREDADSSGVKTEIIRRLWESSRFDKIATRLADLDHNGEEIDIDLLAFRAMSLYQLGREQEAKPVLDVLEARQDDAVAAAWASVLRTVHHETPSEPERVVQVCQDAVNKSPNNPYFIYALGNAYASTNDSDLAMTAWERAATLRPTWAAPHIRQAQTLLNIARSKDALREAQAAVLLAPNSAEAAVVWALARAANLPEGQTDGVEDLLKLVDAIQRVLPGEERTLVLQISLLIQINRRDAAAEAIETALIAEKQISETTLLRLARLSSEARLGLEEACYKLVEKQGGLTAELALVRAIGLADRGKAEEGRRLLESAAEDPIQSRSLDWQIAWVQYLEAIQDPQAKTQWISLADTHEDNLRVQRLACEAKSVQFERDFVDRTIKRIRSLEGDKGVKWRLERARWLLRSPDVEQNAAKAQAILRELVAESPTLVEARLLLARVLERLALTHQAIEQMTNVVRQRPHSTVVALDLARLYQSQRDFDRAGEFLDRVLSDDSARHEDLGRAAVLLARQGQDKKAIDVLEKLQTESGRPDFDLVLAKMYYRRHQIDKTEQICRKLLERPAPASIHFVAAYYAYQGRVNEARSALALLDGLDMPPGMRERLLANHFAHFGPAEHALEKYRAALRQVPDELGLWYELIRYQVMIGQTDEAIATVHEALQSLPDNEALTFVTKNADLVNASSADPTLHPLVVALFDSGERQAAVQALRALVDVQHKTKKLHEVVPMLRRLASQHTSFLALQNLVARKCLALKQTDHAVAIATSAMHAFPTAAEPVWIAADALAAAGRWNELLLVAKEWLKRMVPDDAPNQRVILAQHWANLAVNFRNLKYRNTARQILDAVVTHPGADADAWFLRGYLAEQDDALSVAERSYRMVLKQDPARPEAKNNLAMVLAERDLGLDEALNLAKDAVEACPDNANYLNTLAYLQAKVGDHETAIETMKTAVAHESDNPKWQINLAKILVAAGRQEEADIILKRIESGRESDSPG